MRKFSFLWKMTTAIILATFSISCEMKIDRKTQPAKAVEKLYPQTNIIYGDFIIKEASDYIMIPVNLADQDKDKEIDLNLSRSYTRENKLYNMIFYHKKTGENHLLLNKKAIINSFDLLEIKLTGKPTTRFWLYQIIDKDTNNDNQINNQDAIVGYISDLSGKNLQQITPNNTKIVNWVVLASQNAIFLKIIKDNDQDKQFTEVDQTNFIKVNLDQPVIGTEIISEQVEKDIKSYVLK
ncbi:hypothetical protein VB713_22655 [Anabaena cylindrica UHCC 0172]|uniref:hypothetical protein n=1 Tax=Anabaena cylindrica TaxID=1165 RepID=UPI002B1F8D2F|nr:hypothetical protein [Anabaena cylindrica]MEA5553745.1 hypothetical protein [Anabaena cylindrica UHCC 0172]